MKYGEKLKYLRNKRGLSQKELTERLNLNRSTYARYETSTTQPDFDTLKELANYFDVSIDYLLGHDRPIDDMTDDEIDEELKETQKEMQVWYKSEPKDKRLKLRMIRRMIKSFEEDED